MNFVRENIVCKLFWFVLALHIFNCSVDTPDAQPDYIPEDLSFNDMESVVEILLEKVFEMQNAVIETQDPDTDSENGFSLKKGIDFYCYYPSTFVGLVEFPSEVCKDAWYKESYSEQFHPELIPPPPKA